MSVSTLKAQLFYLGTELNNLWEKLEENRFTLRQKWKAFEHNSVSNFNLISKFKRGEVSYESFKNGCIKTKFVSNDNIIRELYELFDRDNVGYFTYFDFCRVNNQDSA